jgi:hypothetical protein
MMTRRKIHMNLPVLAVGTTDLKSIDSATSSSRPKTSAFWWTKKTTKVQKNSTVDTTNLESKRVGRNYVPPSLSSRPQVSENRSNDACPPASPVTTPTRRTNVTFMLATPLANIREHNLSSPLSPPPLKKRKVVTVDQIQDRDLQRHQMPIIQEFGLENIGIEGDERANRCMKWRLQPRSNPRSYV